MAVQIPQVIPGDYDSEIVVIGGGPTGLLTAIQTQALTGKKITVIEKYAEYQRADIRLNIHPSSLQGMANDEGLKKIVEGWKRGVVPIKEMEEALAQRANELGIKILRGYQAEPKLLPEQFPSAKVFIGADGARSTIRKEILGDQFKFNSNLQYLVQVQYVVNKKPLEDDLAVKSQKIKNFAETYSMQKFAEHLIIQNIRPQEDGSAKVTLQIFIDKDTYEKMSDATFKNPYYLETDLSKVPASLSEILIKWWGAREELHQEVITAEGNKLNKMTVIALGSYVAKEVVKEDEQGRLWVITGDAAAAFPFFRAVNNGMLLSTKLAKCIAKAFEGNKNKTIFSSHFKEYSRYVTKRAYIERIRAYIKNIFISISKFWVKVSSFLPWQTIKFSKAQKRLFYKRGVKIWTRISGTEPPKKPKKNLN